MNSQQHEIAKDLEKRNLIDSLEAMRRNPAPAHAPAPTLLESHPTDTAIITLPANSHEVGQLRNDLRSAQATCALLEEESKRMEEKALTAIAEAGELRQKLNALLAEQTEANTSPGGWEIRNLLDERQKLHACVRQAEDERVLLTRAISDSESEIARLGKTIELLVRKLNIA